MKHSPATAAARGRPSRTSGVLPVALLLLLGSAASFSADPRRPTPPVPPLVPAPDQFPNRATPPAAVLEAHLAACSRGDLDGAYALFSRARRLSIDDAARRDARESDPGPERRRAALRAFLASRRALDLVNDDDGGDHGTPEGPQPGGGVRILSVVGDPSPPRGRLRARVARVRAGGGTYVATLTRQSDWDGKGDPRDRDGFERCWFVWDLKKDDDDEGGEEVEDPLSGGDAKRSLAVVG